MKQLLDHTVEVLALWKVLCDHQLHLLGQSLSAEMRMSLKTTLFRDLILSGSDTCIGLVNSSSIDTWMMRPGRMPSVRN
jgi:nuclear pore complex protein Nup155